MSDLGANDSVALCHIFSMVEYTIWLFNSFIAETWRLIISDLIWNM